MRTHDEVPAQIEGGQPIAFSEGTLHINGSDFTLLPVRNVHSELEVRRAKSWLRNERDVTLLIVRWQDQQ